MENNVTKTVISSSAVGGATLGALGTFYSIASGTALFLPPVSAMVGLTLGAIGSSIYISMTKSRDEKETSRK